MKHLFVPFKLAKQLQEKGFNEPCFRYYDHNDKSLEDFHSEEILPPFTLDKFSETSYLPAPTHQQVVDFFREEKQILIHQVLGFHNKHFCFKIQKWNDAEVGNIDTIQEDSYYKAFNEAIKEALKLI